MTESKVSILLLCFNQGSYLKEAIESVFNQTYSNWELLISDNGSTDGSKELIESYTSDPRVKALLYDSNEYLTKRFNQAFEASEGDFISILFGDDYYLPQKIKNQVEAFKELSPEWGVVHSPGFALDEFTKIKSDDPATDADGYCLKYLLEEYFTKGYINPISPLVTRKCFKEYLSYEDLFTESEAIYFRYALKYKFFYLNEPLVVMRKHDKNASWHSKRNVEIFDICLERLSKSEELPKDCHKSLNRFRTTMLNLGAWENIRLSQLVDSSYVRNRIYKSIGLDFLQLFIPKNIFILILTYLPQTIITMMNGKLDGNSKKQPYFDDAFIKDKES